MKLTECMYAFSLHPLSIHLESCGVKVWYRLFCYHAWSLLTVISVGYEALIRMA